MALFGPRRRELLARIRSDQRRAWAHVLTPAERLHQALGILEVAHLTRGLRPAAHRPSDEPVELLRAIRARLRQADADHSS